MLLGATLVMRPCKTPPCLPAPEGLQQPHGRDLGSSEERKRQYRTEQRREKEELGSSIAEWLNTSLLEPMQPNT